MGVEGIPKIKSAQKVDPTWDRTRDLRLCVTSPALYRLSYPRPYISLSRSTTIMVSSDTIVTLLITGVMLGVLGLIGDSERGREGYNKYKYNVCKLRVGQ